MQECSDDEEEQKEVNTPRQRPKRHSFGDLQDAPLAPEAPRLEVQTRKPRQRSEKFQDRLSRARLAKTREKARELGDDGSQQPSSPALSSLGDVSFDEKLGRVTDKYSRARLARMHRSATGGTLAKAIDGKCELWIVFTPTLSGIYGGRQISGINERSRRFVRVANALSKRRRGSRRRIGRGGGR